MTLTMRGRHLLRGLAFAGVAGAGYVFGITSDSASAQPPAPPGMLPAPQPQPEPDRRVVAYIYGNVPITREELGDFLIARGGHEKLELLINKKIIETEAARRGITVTTVEIKAGLEEDLRSLGINLGDFEKHILPRYHKTLYEWVEDVIKPRLLLTKMCRDRVKVGDQDIQMAFENRYGERRQAKVICWSREDSKTALKQWEEARKSDQDYDRVARTQADPNLAAAAGLVKPIGRYPEGEDAKVVLKLFTLKVGEMSEIIEVPAGLMCVKCVALLPADSNFKLDEKMKTTLHNELFAKKLEQEIPKYFQELKKLAAPNPILTGPPSSAEFREGVRQIINNSGVNQAGGVPPGSTPRP